MTDKNQLTLNQMATGQTGTVVAITGGRGLIARLEALGIRPSKEITKVSTQIFRGPITLRVNGGVQVAIGFGMAHKIVVEVATVVADATTGS